MFGKLSFGSIGETIYWQHKNKGNEKCLLVPNKRKYEYI